MVLHVPFDHLGEESKRHNIKPLAYVSVKGARCAVTVADHNSRLIMQAETGMTKEQASQELTKQGFMVAHGRWLPDPLAGELQIEESLWVASVAYKSYEEKPGLWVNAYRGSPSVGDVLKDFYEEMIAETMLENVSLDSFIESVLPNVVVVSPDDMVSLAGVPCAD